MRTPTSSNLTRACVSGLLFGLSLSAGIALAWYSWQVALFFVVVAIGLMLAEALIFRVPFHFLKRLRHRWYGTQEYSGSLASNEQPKTKFEIWGFWACFLLALLMMLRSVLN